MIYIYTNNIYLCIYTYNIIIYTHNNHSYRGYIPPLQWLEWISIAMKITPGTLGRIPWYSPKISTSYEILWTISSLGFPCTGLLLPLLGSFGERPQRGGILQSLLRSTFRWPGGCLGRCQEWRSGAAQCGRQDGPPVVNFEWIFVGIVGNYWDFNGFHWKWMEIQTSEI